MLGLAAGPFAGCELPSISDEFKAALFGDFGFFASPRQVGFGICIAVGN
jgi:hypothetical protein